MPHAVARSRREVAQQRQPVARGLLGVELRAEDVVALDDRGEALAVVAAADDVVLVGGPADERVHVVEGRARRRGRRVSARRARAAHAVPADVRDLQRRRSSGVDLAGQQAEARARPRARRSARTAAACPRQMPSTRRRRPRRARATPRRARRAAGARIASRERADARDDEAVGAADLVVVGGAADVARRRARAPSRPSGGCPSRSRRRATRAHVSVPLVDGTPGSVGIDRDRRPAARGRTP